MNDVFNTLLEVSLRTLLVLGANNGKSATSDMIAAIDFITVYSKDFDIADVNLHGDNSFKFSEFAVRHDTVSKAVKKLVLDGFVSVAVKKNGFEYAINDNGTNYCLKFESDYAACYTDLASKVWVLVSEQSERDVMELINRHSINSIRGDRVNG
ncbi:MAG: hypothetical protein PHV32_10110 [Eubacteriales bacterium]|nr:hypothetical protein [Eubacteriales bacterium]